MRMSAALPSVVLVLVVLAFPVSTAQAAGGGCLVTHGDSSACTSGHIGEGAVAVQAQALDADPAAGSHAAPTSSRPAMPNDASAPMILHPEPRQVRLAADVDAPCVPGKGACLDGQHAFLPSAKTPVKPADPVPVVPADPGVSLEDVAQFVPRSASIRSQPNGWALVGAPVNLFTDATTQVVDGVLLGRPAQVRFVPVGFAWDHGDGTSTTVQGPGASWRELGQPDFSATDTSHVYPTMGDRNVTLTIAYSPSYRFDGGAWQQIPGTLPVQVGPMTIHVLEGSTVLVSGACGTRDAGPGC